MVLKQSRVSVIIPLYNHAKYITEAVRSVMDQGSIVGEIIVIDDGSSDDSPFVMRKLAKLDDRIRFELQTNRGAHATINRGLEEATGEYVTVLNSDDAYEPGRLDQLVHALDVDEGSDIASSAIAFMNGDSRPIENPWYAQALKGFKTRIDLGLSLIDANFVMTTSNVLMRRSLVEKIGGFAPLRYAHDLEYLLRAAAFGRRLAFVDKPLMRYRFHDSNTISESHQRVRVEWAISAAFFMHLVWSVGKSANWIRAKAAYDILDQHQLTKAVDFCLLYFARHPLLSLEETGIMEDTQFHAFLMDIL